jgi:hypothetical protein
LVILSICLLNENCFAQKKSGHKKKTSIIGTELKPKKIFVFRPDSIPAFELNSNGDTINRTDQFNLKQGPWVLYTPERYGEPSETSIGIYKDNQKTGLWKSYQDVVLIREENYKNDVRDGEIKFYEDGALTCIGYYEGYNPKNKIDTVYAENSQTQEVIVYIVQNEVISNKDSVWTYFNPYNKRIVKREVYSNDELVQEQNFDNIPTSGAEMLKIKDKVLHPDSKAQDPFYNENKKQSRTIQSIASPKNILKGKKG